MRVARTGQVLAWGISKSISFKLIGLPDTMLLSTETGSAETSQLATTLANKLVSVE